MLARFAMFARFAITVSLIFLLGSTWDTALALSAGDTPVTDTRDAYTSALFLDHLHTIIRMSWR